MDREPISSHSIAARNVRVSIDFYKDKTLTKYFDTRRISLEYGANENGAFSFQVPLSFYPQGQYWWIYKIEGADYGM